MTDQDILAAGMAFVLFVAFVVWMWVKGTPDPD